MNQTSTNGSQSRQKRFAFRLLVVGSVIVSGIIMSSSVSIADEQRDLAKIELPPQFEFLCRGEPQPGVPEFPITILEVKCRDGLISNLKGKATVFVEKTRKNGSAVRAKINGFYLGDPRSNDDPQSVSFTTVRHLDVFAEHYFARLPKELVKDSKRFDRFDAEPPIVRNKLREAWLYVELTYFNAAKVPITKRFQMVYPTRKPTSVKQEPAYDHVIDINTIRKVDRHLDFERIAKRIDELFGDPPLATPPEP